MLLLEERVVLADGALLEVALRAERRGLVYRLAWGAAGDWLVRYEREPGKADRRTVRARAEPYAFRSVEQLRYDFERDIEELGGTLGEAP
jgi:hypothetical protein